MQLFISLALAWFLKRNGIPYLQDKCSFSFVSYVDKRYSFEVKEYFCWLMITDVRTGICFTDWWSLGQYRRTWVPLRRCGERTFSVSAKQGTPEFQCGKQREANSFHSARKCQIWELLQEIPHAWELGPAWWPERFHFASLPDWCCAVLSCDLLRL